MLSLKQHCGVFHEHKKLRK